MALEKSLTPSILNAKRKEIIFAMNEIRIDDQIKTDKYLKAAGQSGVYIWGYYEDTVFIPLYVGKSRNIYERLLQHYCRFQSGEYRIPNPNILRDIYVNKYDIDIDPDNFFVYIPYGFGHVINELPKHKDIIELIIRNFAFRFHVIEDEKDRTKAERSLANRIGRNRLITSVPRGGDDNLSPELEAMTIS